LLLLDLKITEKKIDDNCDYEPKSEQLWPGIIPASTRLGLMRMVKRSASCFCLVVMIQILTIDPDIVFFVSCNFWTFMSDDGKNLFEGLLKNII